jgi:hypothetical protein
MCYPECGHEKKFFMNIDQRNDGLMVDENDSRKCVDCMIKLAQQNAEKRKLRAEKRKEQEEEAKKEEKEWIAQDLWECEHSKPAVTWG